MVTKILCELVGASNIDEIALEECEEVLNKIIMTKIAFIPTQFWQIDGSNKKKFKAIATKTNLLNECLRFVQNFMATSSSDTSAKWADKLVSIGFDDTLEVIYNKYGHLGTKRFGWPAMCNTLIGHLRRDKRRYENERKSQEAIAQTLNKKMKNPAQNLNQVVCAGCQKKSSFETPFKICSKCRKVYYCSRECQLTDWKNGHKDICK